MLHASLLPAWFAVARTGAPPERLRADASDWLLGCLWTISDSTGRGVIFRHACLPAFVKMCFSSPKLGKNAIFGAKMLTFSSIQIENMEVMVILVSEWKWGPLSSYNVVHKKEECTLQERRRRREEDCISIFFLLFFGI